MARLPAPFQLHFEAPRNVGRMVGANARGKGENKACGDLLELYLRVEGDKLADVRFQARACSAVIATASLVTEAIRGLAVDDAHAFDVSELVLANGGLPRARQHASQVVARALREALAQHPPRCHPGPTDPEPSAPCSDS